MTINARVDLGSTDNGLGLAVSLTINIFDLNQTLANDLVLAAMKICPYCNAFKDNVPVNISLVSGG
jgi:organic hydroperoxide reductase OsmC/OhrA